MPKITLVPLEVHPNGSETPNYWVGQNSDVQLDAVPFAGGGSVVDDSDLTGYTLRGYTDNSANTAYGSSVTCRFQADDVVAFLIKVRARTDPEWPSTATPRANMNLWWFWRNGLTDSASDTFWWGSGNSAGDGTPISTTSESEFLPLDSTYKWFTTSYGQPEQYIDMNNPSDAGVWVETDLYPGMKEAFAAGTFWMSFEADNNYGSTLLSMIDISEIRLLVATPDPPAYWGVLSAGGPPPLTSRQISIFPSTGVTMTHSGGGSPTGTYVGSAPLSDSDDATYIRFQCTTSGGARDLFSLPLPATSAFTAAEVTAVELHLRVATSDSAGGTASIAIDLSAGADGSGYAGSFGPSPADEVHIPRDATTYDLVVPLEPESDNGITLGQTAQLLVDGGYIEFYPGSGSGLGWTVTIYRAEIVVTYLS